MCAPGVASPTVPSCHDCNSRILGDIPYTSVVERGAYVLGVLQRRLSQTPAPKWTAAEAKAELGPNLRSTVLKGIRAYEKLQQRVAYALGRWGAHLKAVED